MHFNPQEKDCTHTVVKMNQEEFKEEFSYDDLPVKALKMPFTFTVKQQLPNSTNIVKKPNGIAFEVDRHAPKSKSVTVVNDGYVAVKKE